MLPDLQGEVAMITGGASGIGRGLVAACAEAGMKVAVCDIDPARLAEISDELERAGTPHVAVTLDVTDADQWGVAADRVEAAIGTPLLLFNNAGVVASPSPTIDHSLAAWDWLIATNLTATFLGVRAVVPKMIARGRGGHVVNTGSSQSLLASAGYGGYNAAKFGVLGLSETLRIELAEHEIGVSILCPGATRTGLFNNSRSIAPQFVSPGGNPRAVIRRYRQPSEVAALVMEAVKDNRFYIATHREYRSLIDARLAAIKSAFDGEVEPADLANIEEVEHEALATYRAMTKS